jgi:curved DNA-binding protein CbpA
MTDDETSRILAWAEAVDRADYYQILDVDRGADPAELKLAYHRFAIAFHPDSHVGASEQVHAALRSVFQAGAEAYRVLTTPELRIRYDMGLERGELRMRKSQVPPGGADPGPPKPLDEICRSAGAKLCAMRANKLLAAGDLNAAKRALEEALAFDGHANPALTERIEALELAIYARKA